MGNPLIVLKSRGQSIWLDSFRQGMLTSREFKSFVDDDGISGARSNSLVFEWVVTGSHAYDKILRPLARGEKTADDIYWILAIRDARQPGDLLRLIYDQTRGEDGFVSLDILPQPVHDTSIMLVEAREIWAEVDREWSKNSAEHQCLWQQGLEFGEEP